MSLLVTKKMALHSIRPNSGRQSDHSESLHSCMALKVACIDSHTYIHSIYRYNLKNVVCMDLISPAYANTQTRPCRFLLYTHSLRYKHTKQETLLIQSTKRNTHTHICTLPEALKQSPFHVLSAV